MWPVVLIAVCLFAAACAPTPERPWRSGAEQAMSIVWNHGLGLNGALSFPVTWFEGCMDWAAVPGGMANVPGGCELMTLVYGESLMLLWTGSYSSSNFAEALWREAYWEKNGTAPLSVDRIAVNLLNMMLQEAGL